MRRCVLLVWVLGIWTTALFGTPCLPGTLQSYIDLGSGGCQAGAVSFTDFALAPGAGFAAPIDPADVQVSPGGSTLNPLLLFTLNSNANAGEVFQLFFQFFASGPPPLMQASIALTSPAATGDGAVTGILDVCPDDIFPGLPLGCLTSPATAIVFATADASLLSDARSFPPSSFFNVFVDLTIDGGLNGSATLDSASVGVAAIPEPSASLLLAAGLVALGALRARRS